MSDWIDPARVIRFEGPTAFSPRFVGPPLLRWAWVPLASRFEVAVADRERVVWTGSVDAPAADLSAAWPLLPLGPVDVLIRGFDGDREVAVRKHRRFWKVPGFDGVRPAPADWAGAVHRTVGYLLQPARDEVFGYEDGYPRSAWSSFEDSVSGLRGRLAFPAQHHASYIHAYLTYADRFPDHPQAADAERQALAYGRWLLEHHLPDDWRLGGLAPSTVLEGGFGGWVEGDHITVFRAARVGEVMLRLFERTGESRYLERAARIGDVLTDLQNPDGSWPFRVDPRTGEPSIGYTSAVVTPIWLLTLLGEVSGAPGTPPQLAARASAAAKGEAWLLAGPVADGRWEGMYEDIPETPPWSNLQHWDTNETIRYLLSGRCDVPSRAELAARLNAYIEDQFVVWAPEESPVPPHCPTPTVLEQYRCYWPMEVHTGHWLVSLLTLHRETGDDRYVDKALAAANAIVAGQDEQGSLSTWGLDTRFGTRLVTMDWPGCNAVAVSALLHWSAYHEALTDPAAESVPAFASL
ncbi:glycoside hydrolase family protein [Jiangella alkaliphila]|uniref:Uncharacterized protein n=1 Tax=Jiangella alkaliphila TaxID=419479 RepID=A0A1H2JSU7_9ACTN|nr:hypothetical protein [Jiangella alkaliphila]SDU59105.1 hypothetical protein SAMN04488563_3005 [Jiangella alkaliphila]